MMIKTLRRLQGGLASTAMAALLLCTGTPSTQAQTFSAGVPVDWVCFGDCGTSGADGVVDLAPGGGTQFGYVSTALGLMGASPFALGQEFTGSRVTSSAFSAGAGDHLAYQFNYVSSDGNEYADYAWARLVDAGTGSTAAMLFSARTQPAGVLAPSGSLPAVDAQLWPSAALITDPDTDWSPLGTDSGDCWGQGCGTSGWVQSDLTFSTAGSYRLEFGVVNWKDNAYQSGLAFDGTLIGAGTSIAAAVPEPQTWALMLAGLAAMLFMGRRKKRD
jgi:hypothetical protein